MSSLFGTPGASPDPNGQISRDQVLMIIIRTEEQVKSLAHAVGDLRASVEEMVNRLEADADDMKAQIKSDNDEMRKKIEGVGELTNGQRTSAANIENLRRDLEMLKEWRTRADQTIKVMGLASGGVGTVVGALVAHFWK